MISAFGIDHGMVIAKGRAAGGIHRYGGEGRSLVAGEQAMRHRGGEGYFHPSPEQVAASQARRAKQSAYRSDKPNRRVGQKKVPLKAAMNEIGEYKGMIRDVGKKTLLGGGLLAATYGANRYRQEHVAKAEDRREEHAVEVASGAAGGLGGGLLTHGGLNLGGQAAKAKLKQRRYARGTSPNEDKIWSEHHKKHPNGIANTTRHLTYPKSLPDWRAQRALAFKNKVGVRRNLIAAGATAGAAYGVHQAQKEQKH